MPHLSCKQSEQLYVFNPRAGLGDIGNWQGADKLVMVFTTNTNCIIESSQLLVEVVVELVVEVVEVVVVEVIELARPCAWCGGEKVRVRGIISVLISFDSPGENQFAC